MKFAPGTTVIVTRVPENAKQFGVQLGASAVIQPIENEHIRLNLEAIGITVIKIGNFQFYWREDDLGGMQ